MKKLLNRLKYSIKSSQISDLEERYVARKLFSSLPNTDYAILNDLLIPYGTLGRTTQIDHVVVSVHGIFCIETKSHKGWILAIRAKHIFQQILFKYKYPISPNPVVQNAGHIRALNDLLGDKLKAPIMNIVVFPSAEKIIVRGYSHVENTGEAIQDILSQKNKVYSYQAASDMIKKICDSNMKDRDARQSHIAFIRSKYSHG